MVNQVQTAPGSGPAATPNNQLSGNSFLTLLTAQLKQQDPTAPQDPTQFVGQLVQFNSLEQLIQINQKIGAGSATPTATQSSQ